MSIPKPQIATPSPTRSAESGRSGSSDSASSASSLSLPFSAPGSTTTGSSPPLSERSVRDVTPTGMIAGVQMVFVSFDEGPDLDFVDGQQLQDAMRRLETNWKQAAHGAAAPYGQRHEVATRVSDQGLLRERSAYGLGDPALAQLPEGVREPVRSLLEKGAEIIMLAQPEKGVEPDAPEQLVVRMLIGAPEGQRRGALKQWTLGYELTVPELQLQPGMAEGKKLTAVPVVFNQGGPEGKREQSEAHRFSTTGTAPAELFYGALYTGPRPTHLLRVTERLPFTWAEASRRLPTQQKGLALEQVAAKLEQMEEAGRSHGDLKPDNILCALTTGPLPGLRQVDLIDFGSSVDLHRFKELQGQVLRLLAPHEQPEEGQTPRREERTRLLDRSSETSGSAQPVRSPALNKALFELELLLQNGAPAFRPPELRQFLAGGAAQLNPDLIASLNPSKGDVWAFGLVILMTLSADATELMVSGRWEPDQAVLVAARSLAHESDHDAIAASILSDRALSTEEKLKQLVVQGAIDHTQHALLETARSCLTQDPADRPSLASVAQRLGELNATEL